MTKDVTPREVGLSEGLGPEERAKLDALLDHIYEYGTAAEGVTRLAAQLCEAARAAERERCAKVCDDIHARHVAEHGDYIGETYAAECARVIRA